MRSEVVLLALRALNGGLFVVAFALLGEVLAPKRFAGVFAAAPSVALANLLVGIVADGSHEEAIASQGMALGAIAFVVAALAGVRLVRDERALAGSIGMLGVWLAVAVGLVAAL